MAATACFHCGEPIPDSGPRHEVVIQGQAQPLCCTGCEMAAQWIATSGLGAYYRWRTAPAAAPVEAERLEPYRAYDRPEAQRNFVSPLADGTCEAELLVENLNCAACAWLIEGAMSHEPGVARARVNAANGRVLLTFDPARTPLSQLLARLASLGYKPHPQRAGEASALHTRERRQALKRLAVSGLGMMQAMTYALSLYGGDFHGMDPAHAHFLRLVSLLITTPVVLYAGAPFFRQAYRSLRAGRIGMDVPVAVAIAVAFTASAYHTLTGTGPVYFDTVCMFIFFLTVARYLQAAARARAGESGDALARLLPDTCLRETANGLETITLQELATGDHVRVPPGAALPADGRLLDASAWIDESLLTGESRPVHRTRGDRLVAGSLNGAAALRLEVTACNADTTIAHIGRLLRRAQAERPPEAVQADRLAAIFAPTVLLLAAASAWLWRADSAQAMDVALAVLVVTCPCALSIATPTALVAASAQLLSRGVVVLRAAALETLCGVQRAIFDKTGTLTMGQPRITGLEVLREGLSPDQSLAQAAALERAVHHPLARAFTRDAPGLAEPADEVRLISGAGVEGSIGGRILRLGHAEFTSELWGSPAAAAPADDGSSWLLLGDVAGPIAWFGVTDPIRTDAAQALVDLRALGIDSEIASGDAAAVVEAIAAAVQCPQAQGRLRPEDKLARLTALQSAGATVLTVGDGVNDAPLLAQADVSIAMAGGTALAQTSADLILLQDRLDRLPEIIQIARRTHRIIRQNLAWALAYNALAVPLAAMGLVTPWLASLGMSLSSVLVVFNAQRLYRPAKPASRPLSDPAVVQPS